MKKTRIPSALAVVASVALLGCGDLATAPSLDGLGPDLLDMVGDPTIDHNGDGLSCARVLDENTGRVLVIDNTLPDKDGFGSGRKDCPPGFRTSGF